MLSYFGFLDPLKGVAELLQAALMLKERGVRFRLDLHGHFQPDLNAHHAFLRDLAAKLDGDVVRFPGPVPADGPGAEEAFKDTWLGVLPFREGLSERRSSFQALGGAGMPVLTSPGPWQPEWVRDGENVFLEPLDPKGWADRIEALIGQREKLDAVGGRLRTEIVRRHSWERIAKEHLKLWKEIA